MSEFNFKFQPATSIEQSKRLLALGLKKETADMCWRYVNTVKGEKKYELLVEAAWSQEVIDKYVRLGTKIGLFDNLVHPCGKPFTPLEARADVTKNDIPAWSLHRLIEMMPDTITVENATCMGHRFFYLLTFTKGFVTYEVNSFVFKEFAEHDNYYDNIIDCIEWLIKEGYFNKEYLV